MSEGEEHRQLLERIVTAVEAKRRRHWVEIASAVLLAAATLVSAWCVYQSTLWSGVETLKLAEAARLRQDFLELNLEGRQLRAFDAVLTIHYLEAKTTGNKTFEEFLRSRFDAHLRPAVEAWLKTDPLNNPQAPFTPMQMKDYVVKQETLASEKRTEEREAERAARTASDWGDRFVLVTVLCTATLFFCGIGGTFESGRIRTSLFFFALAMFVATLVQLTMMPICRG